MPRLRTGRLSAALAVEQHSVVEADRSLVGPYQSGDEIDQRRLAGARAAEERGDAAGALEARREREFAEALFNVDREHGQASHAAGDTAGERLGEEKRGEGDDDSDCSQAQRRQLAARHLGIGVDRRGHGLGDAGNVADEGDGGAEFTERPREGEDHAGKDAGQRQRQRHGDEDADPAGTERRRSGAQGAGRSPRSTGGWRAPSAGNP